MPCTRLYDWLNTHKYLMKRKPMSRGGLFSSPQANASRLRLPLNFGNRRVDERDIERIIQRINDRINGGEVARHISFSHDDRPALIRTVAARRAKWESDDKVKHTKRHAKRAFAPCLDTIEEDGYFERAAEAAAAPPSEHEQEEEEEAEVVVEEEDDEGEDDDGRCLPIKFASITSKLSFRRHSSGRKPLPLFDPSQARASRQ